MNAKFSLGNVVATPGALESFRRADLQRFLHRHAAGDWGDLTDDDKQANDEALQFGGRLFSAYRSAAGAKCWLITESDRSVTTFLLPVEY